MTRKIGQYCLVCFETLRRASGECVACGHPVRPFERRKYWSLRPSHMRAQKRLIQLAFVLTITVEWVFVTELRGFGRGMGYALAMPWFGFAFLVFVFSHITQHMAVARPGVTLGILPFMSAVVFLDDEPVWGTAFALASVIPFLIRRAFRVWKGSWVAGTAPGVAQPDKADQHPQKQV